MVNIDINIKNIENSMLSETPGYIRQLHQMQSLPYSLSPIGLSRKPPFENRSVLRHHSHRRFRPHRCRQRNNIHGTINIEPKRPKFGQNPPGRTTFDGENCKCRLTCPFPTVLRHNPNRFLGSKSKTMTISDFWGSKNARIWCRMAVRDRMRERKVVKSTFSNEFW